MSLSEIIIEAVETLNYGGNFALGLELIPRFGNTRGSAFISV